MKIEFIGEPELEFGSGSRHIDIRFGLMTHGPLDLGLPTAPSRLRLGIVGTPESVDGFAAWLEGCRGGVDAKTSKQPNLFPRFPGFGNGTMLTADVVADASLQRTIRENEIQRICGLADDNAVVSEAAELLLGELTALVEKGTADVLVCAIPFPLLKRMWEKAVVAGEEHATDLDDAHLDLHDLLKARAMSLGIPLQLVLPHTYDESKRLRQVARDALRKPQDEATRAWNLYVALYYKAGGVPWRLVRTATQLSVCYLGISFYESLDRSSLLTSTAQVFNERGEGIILRGGTAAMSKDDRQPHLDAEGAHDLLVKALGAYRGEHKTQPARILLCKTSSFSLEELRGFKQALEEHHIDLLNLVSIGSAQTRLFRIGDYPPLRGTFLSKDDHRHILYTRGSVDFYETYPGMYIPRSLGLTIAEAESRPRALAEELLALTKMNWNNTQFDNSEPIIATAARKVGRILKYIDVTARPLSRYSFYM